MSTFSQRLLGAARLDRQIFEEVETDSSAGPQAALVVLLGSVAAGVGSSAAGPGALVTGTLAGFIAWVSWAGLTYLIGTRVLPEPQTRADLGQLLRTLAFAATPGLVHVLGIVPALRWPAFAAAWLWMLAAMIVAVRQALDYTSTTRAIAVCALGWTLAIALAGVIGVLFATPVA